ncbi:glycosyl hydrolase 5 family protein-like [Humulus lupulus]|uniref:glycosyl hydrolase 5 family protein-like n=1 Tax=Humulus lupulus TaxID=3486 RepID=UPI002B416B8F|nr:glycosyl hydrolase 5 family protein-like [Humulus lupulus]
MGSSSNLFVSTLFLIVTIMVTLQTGPARALTLSTKSRWIVDENGRRVKLACVNWASHLESAVPEGLSKQPIEAVAGQVSSLGFNCVHLNWATDLATDDSLASRTVRDSFKSLGLTQAISGVETNNPSIIDLPLIEAFKAVVSALGSKNLMVILDNHVSKPSWCCSDSDGNGFFGDKYFDPDLWIEGLTRMASLFKGVGNVVGISLRNELRGPKQNVEDWYKYMQSGAEAVHSANPDLLVIFSGLGYDQDLSFLRDRAVDLTFSGKLVFEVHWYAFSDGNAWENGNANQVCEAVFRKRMRSSWFLLDQGFPLFVSEFGVDQRGINDNDNRYLNCFLAVASKLDFDWGLWTLVGSYYNKQGVVGMPEYYGVLNDDWSGPRSPSLVQKISALNQPFQGPSLSKARRHRIIFHPATGLCLGRKTSVNPLSLGPCSKSDGWYHSPLKNMRSNGNYCLQAIQVGKRTQLSINCSTESNSKWEPYSDANLQLSSKTSNGDRVCLDVDSANHVITNTCKCVGIDDSCDSSSQWFILVDHSTKKLGL